MKKPFWYGVSFVLILRAFMFESIWVPLTFIALLSLVEGASLAFPGHSRFLKLFLLASSLYLVVLPILGGYLTHTFPWAAPALRQRAIWSEIVFSRWVAPPALQEVDYNTVAKRFDDNTGLPLLRYLEMADGQIRVFANGPVDGVAYDPITGRELKWIDKDVVGKIDQKIAQAKLDRQQELEARWAKQRELAAVFPVLDSTTVTSDSVEASSTTTWMPEETTSTTLESRPVMVVRTMVTTTSSSSTISSFKQELESKRAKWRAELEESSRQFNEKMAKYNQERAEQEEAPATIGQSNIECPKLVVSSVRGLLVMEPGDKFEVVSIQSLELNSRLLLKEGVKLTGRVKAIAGDLNRYKLELDSVKGERGIRLEFLPDSIGRRMFLSSDGQISFTVRSVH